MYAWFKKKEKKIKKIPVWNVGKITVKYHLNFTHQNLSEPIKVIEKTYLGWVRDPLDDMWGYVKPMSSSKAKNFIRELFSEHCIFSEGLGIPVKEILYVEICPRQDMYVDKDDNDIEFNEMVHEVK
jgi:hypothetical protein